MQLDDTKQLTKMKMIKKVWWWILVTVVAAPLAKWGEERLNLSILSPAIDGVCNGIKNVGHWLGISILFPLWMLVAITVWTLLLGGIVIWVIIDARRKLQVADDELNTASAKIANLQQPMVHPLSGIQDKVIAAIAVFDNDGSRCLTKEIPAYIGLSLLQTEGAIDVLENRKLIMVMRPVSGKYVTLTAAGRAYVLNPDFKHTLVLSQLK